MGRPIGSNRGQGRRRARRHIVRSAAKHLSLFAMVLMVFLGAVMFLFEQNLAHERAVAQHAREVGATTQTADVRLSPDGGRKEPWTLLGINKITASRPLDASESGIVRK
ncbi:hypothetical protein AU467_25955 [Mesorhizobium loti]|uniref:Uncharacterized protein n=1 Tax=Rhizobium loti TaxID=381 RepID=A0A124GG44_RHILI|nr:hypothetical protein AU467_25955 [Mesorhizobium loti]